MSDLKPALTPEEWAHALSWSHGLKDYIVERADQFGYGGDGPADLHSMAALCLNGQPFGFTHEDVRDLRRQADALELSYALAAAFVPPSDHARDTPAVSAMAMRFRAIADRIAALLPPEAP